MTIRKILMTTIVLTVLTLLVQLPLSGNDGRDRYAGAYANELWLFPDAPVECAGYRVLKEDGPGGADDDRAFRWTSKQAIALVRVAAYETEKTLGRGKHPMPVFDLSAENGDTPVGFEKNKPPRGRHPGGSHDGGYNLDLGYYLTSLKGRYYSPDHSACTDHFEKKNPNVKSETPKDTYMCGGYPDRLDVRRQSFFMLRLFQINRELFDGELLEQIGMDWEIQKAILREMEQWVIDNKHGVTKEDIEDMRRICIADSFEGWAWSHHHHIHLRIRNISLLGKHRDAFLTLFERERRLDAQLLAAKAKEGEPLLRVRLYSYAMQRALQAEILNALPEGTEVKFRLDGEKWVEAEKADWTRTRAFLELPLVMGKKPRKINVEAQLNYPDKTTKTAVVEFVLPRLEPYLFVSVDKEKISASIKRTEQHWKLKIDAPEIYRTYITGVSFEVSRLEEGKTVVKSYDASMKDFSYTLENPGDAIQLVVGKVVVSSRIRIRIPVYCKAP